MTLSPLVFHLHLIFKNWNLFAETRPGPSQVFNINFFTRLVDAFKLTLVTMFLKSIIMYD